MSVAVGLVGARGHVGREVLRLVARHPELDLSFAVSRQWAGELVAARAPVDSDVAFEALSPADIAERAADVIILGLPNSQSAPFVDAIQARRPDTVILDLSADHRHVDWTYGLTELNRAALKGAVRIANPGCYASAAQFALAPLKDRIEGPAAVFGVSGYSGAGTSASRKNDVDALADNIMPYALTGHGHEREIASAGDWCYPHIRFAPSVAGFFRGLVVTIRAKLRPNLSEADVRTALEQTYQGEAFVQVQTDPAEPKAVANTPLCVVGGLMVEASTGDVAITAALDNLLKGAASQAVQNINLALGLDEALGLNAPTATITR